MKENREDRILLGGDFNGRIGERGGRNWVKGRGGWEKKIQRQGGKCRGEGLKGNKQEDEKGEMDLYRQQVGNSDRLRNGERRSTGNSRRIQNRSESKIIGKFQHIKLTKESNKSTLCNRKKLCIAITFL
jgi:hypothetical protein